MATLSPALSTKGLLNLFVVYLVWGSTYLFIRLTVQEGSGFPPFAMAASRTLCASAILFGLAVAFGQRLRLPGSQLKILIVSGILLWTGGNGLVVWAERQADSGYAALVVGTTPMWPVILESILDRKTPSVFLILFLLIGFSGLAVLVAPALRPGLPVEASATAALLAAALAWSGGSLLLQRRPPAAKPLVISAYQHFFGGLGLTAAALFTGEPWPHPSGLAWLGWTYLLVFGSLISFTSFIVAVRHLPLSVVMTYAYVNPVIAVILGRLVLGERITASTVTGMALILIGVSGVFWQRFGSGRKDRRRPGDWD
ncbi:MAG: EamA family transporter [Deltaproteobacteria bacterium]|nr:EamA family transporter [Deltaproteobacteria bacterium]